MSEETQVAGIIMPNADEDEVAGSIVQDADGEEVAKGDRGLIPCL